ncbi:MAG: CoA transferase [Betaproteobacteria bacterium]|nr:CoA transferase [Betaproteobacteria bacterium]
MQQPLEDIKVLDLTHALAGPFCSTMLADYGAQVFKLEAYGAGDIARGWGAPLPGGETGYFTSLHRNKKDIEVNLKHPRGKEIFFSLIERCDVVVENFRVGTLEKLDLDYPRARARNPGIIYCSISGFGQDGPYRDRAALDLVVQAESGMMSVTGEAGGRPVRAGTSIADLTAGMYAAFGILAALRVRQRTGEGQALDVSMMDGQLSWLNTAIGNYLADGIVPGPMGTTYASLLPYQTFRTKTRDLALAVASEKLWKTFCPLIGCPELADDPRYRTNQDRVKNRDSLIPRLEQVFRARSYEEWEKLLVEAGVPVGAVNDFAQVVDHPQVKARRSLVEVDHPRAGRIRVVAPVVRMSATPGAVRTPAPALGEHTEEVLRDFLGLAPEAITGLRAAHAIGPSR